MIRFKKCGKCKKVKAVKEFGKDSRHKDKLTSTCNICISNYNKNYRKQNIEKINNNQINWRIRNPDYYNLYSKTYRTKHPKKVKQAQKSWWKRNPTYLQVWRQAHPVLTKSQRQKSNKLYRSTSKGVLNCKMSDGIYKSLKSNKAGRHWETLVGYTLNDLKKDFESKYYNRMSWESFKLKDTIHIHHIIKQSGFHYKTAEDTEFKQCWALSNLQPLWKEDHKALHQRLDSQLNALMLINPIEEQIECLCRKHLKYTLAHSLHKQKIKMNESTEKVIE